MNTEASEGQEWLSNPSARLLFSQQLGMTGRSLLREVQARHFPPGFVRLLNQTLHAPQRLLSSPVLQGHPVDDADLKLWALLALLTATSASGAQTSTLANLAPALWRRARAVAAAAELLGAALDIIDDVQDGDSTFVQRIGVPIALNIGLALLELAPLALGRARRAGWPDSTADAALETFHSSLLTSLGGQFLDLRFEQMPRVSEAQVMEMTQKKSGTVLALICQLGAMVGATTSQRMTTEYFEAASHFGGQLGIWSQLLNDLHDAELAQVETGKSDRRRGKKTLPLILEGRDMLEATDKEKQEWSPNTQAALAYTYVIAEKFRLRARKALLTLEERFGPHPLLWPLVSEHHRARRPDQ